MVPLFVRLGMFTTSCLSLFFLPKKSFYKYLPVSLFTSTLVLGVCALSISKKLWVIKGNKTTRILNDLSFVFGAFFAGTMWIFHFTYGKFRNYITLNLFMNLLLSYPLSYLFQKLKIFKYENMKGKQIFLTYFGFSFIIYGYQLLLDKCAPYFK